ncbi:inhibin beta B chain-like [Acipenser oxyrinchus oxyrinchus]|uniref:Inhibin beta B chain-like n=1 Tax=Acipenser oxyrinchus oxyrinchus TaxID=40147 RepID=A0AAD8CH99_ACIOX|nr:inhibin beta B chain-like [Acipenser oxyrinchus oxyrinchus]
MGSSDVQSGVRCVSLMLVLLVAATSSQTPGDAGCLTCGMPALEKGTEEQLLIEIAKLQILSKLHLKERPNITHPVPRAVLLTALKKLHAGRVRQDGTLELNSNLERQNARAKDQGYEIVSFADTDHRDAAKSGLTFQFSKERGMNFQILQSTLWLYFKSSSEAPKERVTAKVFLAGPHQSNRTLLSQKQFDVKWGSWQTFPITRGVQNIFDRGNKQVKLVLECEGCQDLAVLGSLSNASHQPFLVAQVRVREEHSIHKRSLDCDTNINLCCKKDIYVSFRDIGWQDWIIAPDGYHMNYCMGLCREHFAGAPGIAASFHAAVFNQLKANGIHSAVSSCCVPTQRRPLSMLYFDASHNIVKTDIPDMIVEACGCT